MPKTSGTEVLEGDGGICLTTWLQEVISQRKVGMGICLGSPICLLEAVEYSTVVVLLIKYCMMVYWPSFNFNR